MSQQLELEQQQLELEQQQLELERVLHALTCRLQQVGVRDESGQDGFTREYSKLKRKSVKHRNDRSFPTAAGELPENSKKNRYKDILPFDYSRVVLSLQTDEATSDYINANFVQGLNGPRTYIATQGPLAHTVIDFWRMIWEYEIQVETQLHGDAGDYNATVIWECDIQVIVMACQEVEAAKRKCEMYWAEENKPNTYGSFLVECDSMEGSKQDRAAIPSQETDDACKGYFVRTLKVTFKEETREIFHFQFPSWPDHGVPESPHSILCMVAHIHRKQGAAASPICMHCSAGCGRTGALCVIHYTWDLIKSKRIEENFSIFNVIQEIRTQRPAAVQTKDQYEFVYRAISTMFSNELDKNPDYENLSAHYEKLESYYTDVLQSGKPMQRPCIPLKTSRLSVPSPNAGDRAESPTKSPARKKIFPPAEDSGSSRSGGGRKPAELPSERCGRDDAVQPRWKSDYEVVIVPEKPMRSRPYETYGAPVTPDYENLFVSNGGNGGNGGGKARVGGGGAAQHYEVAAPSPGPPPADPSGVDRLYSAVTPRNQRPGKLAKSSSVDSGSEGGGGGGDRGQSSVPGGLVTPLYSQVQPPRLPAAIYREASPPQGPMAGAAFYSEDGALSAAWSRNCAASSQDKTEYVITAPDGADDTLLKGNPKTTSLPFNIKQGVKIFGKQLFGKSEPPSAATTEKPGVLKAANNSDYEDVETSQNHISSTAAVNTSNMGFGHRLARPRGPRQPPADWPSF
ncbi:uncharacterized protein LOC133355528 isoform X2 [Lethenteron reissneri]|uniref:uncharacterized protein LOC133355528 isoform X2 n=1 Tax=Lethenteron reissneri TaxID=7753 RepID=UPI002AB6AADD|nr:uncharacterized protein LOC133355528 isoform X2 [Lethenteron reissneri]